MFALQGLNTGQVMTVVVSVEGLVFFFNPLFGFISISEDRNEKTVFSTDLKCKRMALAHHRQHWAIEHGNLSYLWKRCTS